MNTQTAPDMTAYWQNAHALEIRGALTGNTLQRHQQFLQFMLLGQGHVLCIGVGDGKWVREAVAAGCKVSSLDICEAALNKVRDLGPVYLPHDALPADAYDWAISLWVSPHMLPEDLEAQLKKVIPALKREGILAIHYNEPFGRPIRDIANYEPDKFLAGGGVEYAREDFVRMVERAGGRIVKCVHEMESPNYGKKLVGMHVGRAT